MLAHEFQPKAEQGLDRAQQRMQRVGRAALVMPRERHGDDALEGIAKHAGAAGMRQPVGAARHEHESDDVEDAEAGPQGQRMAVRPSFSAIASMMRPNRIGSAIITMPSATLAAQISGHLLPFGSESTAVLANRFRTKTQVYPHAPNYCALHNWTDSYRPNAAALSMSPKHARFPNIEQEIH